ncbi:hypothetical protein ACLIYN_25720, partial [Streptomyces atacamensis]
MISPHTPPSSPEPAPRSAGSREAGASREAEAPEVPAAPGARRALGAALTAGGVEVLTVDYSEV